MVAKNYWRDRSSFSFAQRRVWITGMGYRYSPFKATSAIRPSITRARSFDSPTVPSTRFRIQCYADPLIFNSVSCRQFSFLDSFTSIWKAHFSFESYFRPFLSFLSVTCFSPKATLISSSHPPTPGCLWSARPFHGVSHYSASGLSHSFSEVQAF